jgi:hypothetical protein
MQSLDATYSDQSVSQRRNRGREGRMGDESRCLINATRVASFKILNNMIKELIRKNYLPPSLLLLN